MMSCRQFSKSFSSLKYLLLIREKDREDSALPGPVKRKKTGVFRISPWLVWVTGVRL